MAAPVTHFEINVKDGKRAYAFYSDLFGWKVQDLPGANYGMVDTGVKMGINGGIGQVEASDWPRSVFYVQVEDVQAHLDKAVSLGGKIVAPLIVIPDMVTYALFSDPEGNVIGLIQGPQTPPKEAKPEKRVAKKKKVAKAKAKTKPTAKRKSRRK
jgi:predicted enzyme related to lactoylglutathione lyase